MEIFTYENNEDVKELIDRFQFQNELKDIRVYCNYYETRNSWGHKGHVENNTHYLNKGKIRYWNRTWECYTYQSLLKYLVRGAMTMLSGIDYQYVLTLKDDELNDIKVMKSKEFRDKYTWCSAKDYRETKKHLKRIGVIQ